MALPPPEMTSHEGETTAASTLTLDISGDDTFADAQKGDRNVCVSVWGTVEANDGGTLVLTVDRAELMPSEETEEEEEDEAEEEFPAASKAPYPPKKSVPPKSVVSSMVGKAPPKAV